MKTVLISGSSIAGPALAYWLQEYGFKPTVVERTAAPRAGGQAIDIRGVALEVCNRMGILDRARAMRTQMTGMSVLDADGTEVWRSEEMTFSGGRFDNDDVELLRDDLSKLLLDKVGSDVEIVYGDSIVALEHRDRGLEVTFHSGARRSFDLLVGADGIHSNVRALAFGDESQFLRPLGIGLAVFSTPNVLNLDNWQIAYREAEAGYVVYPARDNTELRVGMGFAAQMTDEQRGSVERQKAFVAERCAHLRWEIPRLLDLMRDAEDFYFGAMAQVQMHCWSKGRVALVGDAAYCPTPMSGQGTSLALVGAYILAKELGSEAPDHETTFRRYEARMRPFVGLNQALAMRDRGQPLDEGALTKAKNAIALDD